MRVRVKHVLVLLCASASFANAVRTREEKQINGVGTTESAARAAMRSQAEARWGNDFSELKNISCGESPYGGYQCKATPLIKLPLEEATGEKYYAHGDSSEECAADLIRKSKERYGNVIRFEDASARTGTGGTVYCEGRPVYKY